MSNEENNTIEVSQEVKERYMDDEDAEVFDTEDNGDDGGYAVSPESSGSSEPEIWDSGLEVMDNPVVIVPEEVRRVCVALQEAVGYNEFGVLFKGEWTKEGFKVKPDFVVPDQEVSTATVQFEEDLKKYRDQGYIVHTHSHPMSGKSAGFSGVDDEHSNSHFDVALLYGGQDDAIAGACANIKVCSGGYVQITPRVRREPRIKETMDELEEVRMKMESLGIDEAVQLLDRVEEVDTDLPSVETENIEIRGSKTRNRGGRGNGSGSYKVPSKYQRSSYERRKGGRRFHGAGKQVTLEGDEADEKEVEKALDEIESGVNWEGCYR